MAATPFFVASADRNRAQPWRRFRYRRWIRPSSLPSPELMLSAIPSLPRSVLSRLAERMIDRMDEIDGDPDLEPAGFNEGYVRDYRSAEHRDVAAYLAGCDDEEDDDPAEDDGISNEDDDPREDEDNDLAADDVGDGFTAVECINQSDWAGASLAHGDGLRHEDEEDDDPRGWRRRGKRR